MVAIHPQQCDYRGTTDQCDYSGTTDQCGHSSTHPTLLQLVQQWATPLVLPLEMSMNLRKVAKWPEKAPSIYLGLLLVERRLYRNIC